MEATKAHLCPTCGGSLQIDEERRLYLCPYCGVTFDYEYFREDDVLDKADNARRMGEYNSAMQAYEFMLSKDPHNFGALLGIILAGHGMSSVNDLSKADKYGKVLFKNIPESALSAIEGCVDEDREYLKKVLVIMDKIKRYKADCEAIDSITSDRKKVESKISDLYTAVEESKPAVYTRDTWERYPYDPKNGLIVTGIVYAVILIFGLILSMMISSYLPLFWIAIITSFPAAGFALYLYTRMRAVNEAQLAVNSEVRRSEDMARQIKEKEEDCRKIRADIAHIIHDLKKIKSVED